MSIDEPGTDLDIMFAIAEAEDELRPKDPSDPRVIAAKRTRRRRRIIAASVVFLLVGGAVGTYLPLTLLAPLSPATGTITIPPIAVPAAVALTYPKTGASAVSIIGADEFPATLGTNGIFGSSGGNDPRSIASISKVVTALVILDKVPLGADDDGPTLTFSKADNATYDQYYVLGATIQPMKIGSSLSLHDALELMLVVSASNYADVVSTQVFGSRANYLSATRTWLAANGMTGTTIVEPTGIDPRNTSTPTDLITLGKLALASPAVASIMKMPMLRVAGFDQQASSNNVLGTDGINGVKTGTLDEAGSCLLFTAVVDVGLGAPITIVGVVLGGTDHYGVGIAAQTLIEGIVAGFHQVPLMSAGTQLGVYDTPWGEKAHVIANDGASILTWSDTPVTVSVTRSSAKMGVKNATVGAVTYVAGARTATVSLELDDWLTGPGGWWRVTHPGELLAQ